MESKQPAFAQNSGCMTTPDGRIVRAASKGNVLARRPSVAPKNLADELARRNTSGPSAQERIASAMSAGDVSAAATIMQEEGIRHVKGAEYARRETPKHGQNRKM